MTNWVGFELLLKEHLLGLTECCSFEEALGRMVFATGALELLRPFLVPFYAFATSGPIDSVRPVPAYVSFLRFLARSVEQERHTQCGADVIHEEGGPRVDAQASDERTGVQQRDEMADLILRTLTGSLKKSPSRIFLGFPGRMVRRRESLLRLRHWQCYLRFVPSSQAPRGTRGRSSRWSPPTRITGVMALC